MPGLRSQSCSLFKFRPNGSSYNDKRRSLGAVETLITQRFWEKGLCQFAVSERHGFYASAIYDTARTITFPSGRAAVRLCAHSEHFKQQLKG